MLKTRYINHHLFTGVGNELLISCNPFTGVFNEDKKPDFLDLINKDGLENMEPHLFGFLQGMHFNCKDVKEPRNQFLVPTGISGSGKVRASPICF